MFGQQIRNHLPRPCNVAEPAKRRAASPPRVPWCPVAPPRRLCLPLPPAVAASASAVPRPRRRLCLTSSDLTSSDLTSLARTTWPDRRAGVGAQHVTGAGGARASRRSSRACPAGSSASTRRVSAAAAAAAAAAGGGGGGGGGALEGQVGAGAGVRACVRCGGGKRERSRGDKRSRGDGKASHPPLITLGALDGSVAASIDEAEPPTRNARARVSRTVAASASCLPPAFAGALICHRHTTWWRKSRRLGRHCSKTWHVLRSGEPARTGQR